MYVICFYVPASHSEEVKSAMFAAGAGRLGNYAACAWQTMGQGQFMPLPSSNPFIGNINKVEIVTEYKIEMICTDNCLDNVITALKEHHPYETPAYYIVKTHPS